MIGSRRAHRRPYFFEIFVAAHLIFILAVIKTRGPDISLLIAGDVISTIIMLATQALGGVLLRWIVEAFRGRGRRFLRRVGSRGWMTDSLRLVVFGALSTGVYGAIKLLVPIYHPVLYDRALWDLEQRMFGGYAPVVFVISLFSNPKLLWFFDAAYAKIFFTSLFIAFGFFLSHPSRRVRVAFANGNVTLWIVGAWLYLLIPSLGPAYAFPDLWIQIRDLTPVTNVWHVKLMVNYKNVLKLTRGIDAPLTFMYGIAAFPSMHVAFQTFVFLWMRRLWISGQVIFGVFTLIIFLGSMITGWHYLIDGLAGFALALACYWAFARNLGRADVPVLPAARERG